MESLFSVIWFIIHLCSYPPQALRYAHCGAVLCSNENLNATYLYSTIAGEVLPGKEEKGSDTFTFDDMAIGTTFPVASNGEAKSATAEIVEDPDGVSGHVIHVAKASIAFSATNTSSENVGLWDKSDNRIEPYAGTVNGLTKNTIHFAK